jgi:hypothetical protein
MVGSQSLLSKMDFYGAALSFRIDDSPKYKTSIGGIASIITIVAFIFLLYNFGLEMFDRSHPFLRSNLIYDPDNTTISISDSKELFFSLTLCKRGLDDTCEFNYDPSIFTISFNLITTSYRDNIRFYEVKTLNYSYCTEDDIHPDLQARFIKNKLNNALCVRDQNITIQGEFESPIFQYFRISVDKCQKNCRSEEEIKEQLSMYKMSFYYTFANENASNYDNPFAVQLANYGINLSYDFFRRKDMFFQKNMVVDDENIIFRDNQGNNKATFSTFDGQADEMVENGKNTHHFFGAFIRTSSNHLKINRSYKKIAIILSEAMAILKYLILGMAVFLNITNYHSLQNNIIETYLDQENRKINTSTPEQHTINRSLIEKNSVVVKKKRCCSQKQVPSYYAFMRLIMCCKPRNKKFLEYEKVLNSTEEIFSIQGYIELYLYNKEVKQVLGTRLPSISKKEEDIERPNSFCYRMRTKTLGVNTNIY